MFRLMMMNSRSDKKTCEPRGMKNAMSREAWKDTGDCAECRRMDYCKKNCSAYEDRMDRIYKEIFDRMIRERFVRSPSTGKLYPMLAHLAEEKQNG